MQFCRLWQFRRADSSVGGPHTWNSLQHTREKGDVIDKKNVAVILAPKILFLCTVLRIIIGKRTCFS